MFYNIVFKKYVFPCPGGANIATDMHYSSNFVN